MTAAATTCPHTAVFRRPSAAGALFRQSVHLPPSWPDEDSSSRFMRFCRRAPSECAPKISGNRTLEGQIACLPPRSTRLYFLAAIAGTGLVLWGSSRSTPARRTQTVWFRLGLQCGRRARGISDLRPGLLRPFLASLRLVDGAPLWTISANWFQSSLMAAIPLLDQLSLA